MMQCVLLAAGPNTPVIRTVSPAASAAARCAVQYARVEHGCGLGWAPFPAPQSASSAGDDPLNAPRYQKPACAGLAAASVTATTSTAAPTAHWSIHRYGHQGDMRMEPSS